MVIHQDGFDQPTDRTSTDWLSELPDAGQFSTSALRKLPIVNENIGVRIVPHEAGRMPIR
jgi:hypothetical protein